MRKNTEGIKFSSVWCCNVGELGPSFTRASLVAQLVKNPPAMWETWVQSLGWKDRLEEGMATHQYSCLENPHGQRSLAGYSLSGPKESDTTERLSTAHRLSLKSFL